MYLFLGGEKTARKQEIVGIFDLDTASISPVTRSFLKEAEKKKQVVTVKEDLPKSFVLTKQNKNQTVYLSPLSSSVLKKRANANL